MRELLLLLAEMPEMSAARAARKLGIQQSQLRRVLTCLGDNAALGGLGLVRVSGDEERLLLALTDSGRQQVETLLQPAGIHTVPALRVDGGSRLESHEPVIEEMPVALVYNGISHAVMMATPTDLEDFALGFSLSEGIINSVEELYDIDVVPEPAGISLNLKIPESHFAALKERRRTLAGRTGCGLCGVEALTEAIRPLRRVEQPLRISAASLAEGFARLEQQQTLNRATGAAHAAALLQDGNLLLREDVGRHNALDKLIGAAALAGWRTGAVLVTSRASYEMVAKTAAANFPLLAAISAPTSLAVALAERAGLSLIGFAREGRLTVFTGGERVLP